MLNSRGSICNEMKGSVCLKSPLSEHEKENLISGEDHPRHSVNLETICKIYNWKKATVYGWVHDSFIPHSKVGKRLYFNIPEIEKWIATGRRKTISEMAREADRYMIKRRGSRS